MKEALEERSYFIENAYYMNKQIPIVIPCDNVFQSLYYYLGCLVYHAVYLYTKNSDSKLRFNPPTIMTSDQLKINFPYLDKKYQQGVVYWDGSFNDSRMNLDLLLTGIFREIQFLIPASRK